ncbi:hypothetical protein D3C83_185020 [compost metagenome]
MGVSWDAAGGTGAVQGGAGAGLSKASVWSRSAQEGKMSRAVADESMLKKL